MSRDSRPVDPADRELAQAADAVLDAVGQLRKVRQAHLRNRSESPRAYSAALTALMASYATYERAKARVKT